MSPLNESTQYSDCEFVDQYLEGGDLPVTLDDFRREELLGEGGMSRVWRAHQTSLGRTVALKVLSVRALGSRNGRKRFRLEAETLAQLRHPNIVSLYAVNLEGDHPFIAQELVGNGQTLEHWIALSRATRSTPPQNHYFRLATIFEKCARALSHAHETGVIHRDIKPSNVLLEEIDGVLEPKIADFGMAIVNSQHELSNSNSRLGTPFYMSPEQIERDSRELDQRTDVYSLGATLYEALTLNRPFEGDTTGEVFKKILTDDAMHPRKVRSQIPLDLAAICMKAMESDRRHRYRAIDDFASDLRRFLNHEPIMAKPSSRRLRFVKWTKRNPAKSTASALGFVSVAALLIANVFIMNQRSHLLHAQEVQEQALYFSRLNSALASNSSGDTWFAIDRLTACSIERRGLEWGLADVHIDQSMDVLIDCGVPIVALDASPSGRWLAALRSDGLVEVWDFPSRTKALSFSIGEGGRRASLDLAFQGEDRLLTRNKEGKVVVWDRIDGSESRVLVDHGASSAGVSVSSDDLQVAWVDAEDTVHVLDVSSFQVRYSFPHPRQEERAIHRVFIDSANNRLWVSFWPEDLVAWDLSKGTKLYDSADDPVKHDGSIEAMITSPNNGLLIAGARDSHVSIRDAEAPDEARFHFAGDWVFSLSISESLNRLWAGRRDGRIHTYDLDTGVRYSLSGHDGTVVGLVSIPGESLVVSAALDGKVLLWDEETLPSRYTFYSHTSSGAFEVDVNELNQLLISCSAYGAVVVSDLKSGVRTGTFWKPNKGTQNCLRLSPNGEVFAIGDDDGDVYLVDARSCELLCLWRAHEEGVLSIEFSSRLGLIATTSVEGEGKVWELEEVLEGGRQSSLEFKAHQVAFLDEKGEIVVVTREGALKLLSVSSGAEVWMNNLNAECFTLAIEPGEKLITVGGSNGFMAMIDSRLGQVVHTLELGPAQTVLHLEYNEDGSRLFFGNNEFVSVLDTRTWMRSFRLETNYWAINDLAFDDSNNRLFIADGSGGVVVHDGSRIAARLFWRTKRIQGYVDRVFEDELLVAWAINRIKSEGVMSGQELSKAVAYAEVRGHVHRVRLNGEAWSVVSHAGHHIDQYERALALAQAANQMYSGRDYSVKNTLGVALYRVGKYMEAIECLEGAGRLRSSGRPQAFDLPFIAMSHWMLGDHEEAERAMGELASFSSEIQEDDELRRFLEEAKALTGHGGG